MTIAVFSDSHGSVSEMEKILKAGKYDLAFHLGNDISDIKKLRHDGMPPFYLVRGNGDGYKDAPSALTLAIEGVKLYLCHGHTLSVKRCVSLLASAAKEEGAHAALFGHTHVPFEGAESGVLLFNPGTVSGAWTGVQTFGVLCLENGGLSYRIETS